MKNYTYIGKTELRSEPRNLAKEDLYLFEHEFRKRIEDSFILIEKNIYLLGKNIININQLKIYLKHTYMNKPSIKNILKIILKFWKSRFKQIRKINTGVWVINNKSENYFHWMTEVLARVLSFQKLGYKHKILLPAHFEKLEFVSKTLELLNIKYETYSSENLVKVEKLYLTNHTAPAGNYNSNIIKDLHLKLNNNTKSIDEKRLWVSRKYSKRRFLINEEEIEPILNEFKIEIVYPEQLDYTEQCILFREAQFLGGVAGAALANMLFMETNSTILELRARNDDLNNCHFSLASALNNNFYYMICDYDSDYNSIVNVEELRLNLTKIFKT